MKGITKWFDAKKGFGFILAEGVEADIFVHFAEIQGKEGEFKTLKTGEEVDFELVEVKAEDGSTKPQAHKVIRSYKSDESESK